MTYLSMPKSIIIIISSSSSINSILASLQHLFIGDRANCG